MRVCKVWVRVCEVWVRVRGVCVSGMRAVLNATCVQVDVTDLNVHARVCVCVRVCACLVKPCVMLSGVTYS